jgi:PAS domain S-box-containing protein
MLRIAIIIPRDLVIVAQSAASNFKEDIKIIEGSMERGLELAREFEAKKFDVIIARGGTQLLLKSSRLNIPTVPIPITVIDIFNAINEAEKISNNIAILAFDNMLGASENLIKISGNNYHIIQVNDEKDVEDRIRYLSNRGYNVIVGGGIIERYGAKYNLKTIVIKTGREAIISAIEEAIRVAIATREENKRGERFRTIVQNSNDGIISIDKDGYINIFNATAEKLLKIRNSEVIGKHIDNVLPQLGLLEVLYSGIEDRENIKNIMDNKIMVSNIPIKVNGVVVDAVSMLQDVDKIQQMEEKIRREITTSGLYAKYTFDDIVGISKESSEAIRIGKEYAKVNSTILIEGETGTGKEVMAQSIHNYSDRSKGPFVAVNCAALPESLLESELFGYAPGSFTGADRKGKRGLFELAHGGTIFLDEISEMNPMVQGRLLRVLQENQVMRIGDNKVIPIDIRVITATNKNLYKLVLESKFREDLFYRLNVLQITMSPLRNKKADIPALIAHFNKGYSQKFARPPLIIDDDALAYICSYNWPGNIRELRNFIERLIVISKKPNIKVDDIKGKFLFSDKECIAQKQVELINQKDGYKTKKNATEEELIIQALQNNMGIINLTAKSLGISRSTLWRKVKKFEIDVSKIKKFQQLKQ